MDSVIRERFCKIIHAPAGEAKTNPEIIVVKAKPIFPVGQFPSQEYTGVD
jgi:hypothetical protein